MDNQARHPYRLPEEGHVNKIDLTPQATDLTPQATFVPNVLLPHELVW
jgi:hypothetical protein